MTSRKWAFKRYKNSINIAFIEKTAINKNLRINTIIEIIGYEKE